MINTFNPLNRDLIDLIRSKRGCFLNYREDQVKYDLQISFDSTLLQGRIDQDRHCVLSKLPENYQEVISTYIVDIFKILDNHRIAIELDFRDHKVNSNILVVRGCKGKKNHDAFASVSTIIKLHMHYTSQIIAKETIVDLWINTDLVSLKLLKTSFGKLLLAHEIGHVLGLKHPPGEFDFNSTVMSTNAYKYLSCFDDVNTFKFSSSVDCEWFNSNKYSHYAYFYTKEDLVAMVKEWEYETGKELDYFPKYMEDILIYGNSMLEVKNRTYKMPYSPELDDKIPDNPIVNNYIKYQVIILCTMGIFKFISRFCRKIYKGINKSNSELVEQRLYKCRNKAQASMFKDALIANQSQSLKSFESKRQWQVPKTLNASNTLHCSRIFKPRS